MKNIQKFFGNFGILKDRRLLGAWGPYKELNLNEYKYLIKLINLKKEISYSYNSWMA